MAYNKTRFNETIVFIISLALLFVWAGPGLADVKLPTLISDNMVLQQGIQVPIWGWAQPAEKVVIGLSIYSQVWGAEADKEGKWMVKIGPFNAGGPYELTVKGKNTITIKNVLVGEVWVCSGQSNMAWSLERADNPEREITAANHPNIRLFTVERRAYGHPLSDCVGRWSQCKPETAAKFSAVAYFFGRYLHKELNIPIGLINTSWGGTRIEPWTPPAGFESVEELRDVCQQITEADTEYRKAVAESLDITEVWLRQTRKALAKNQAVPTAPPWPKHPLSSHRQPTGLYNAMVHPLVPFGIRGGIWYQGESNREDGLLYYEKMKALINGWRTVWQQGAFPFYFVQLAPYRYGGDPLLLPQIWQAQKNALSIPNTGMAVITDIGNLTNIHPTNKQDVGKRLALWALAKTYGQNNLVYSGPLYNSMSVEGNKIRIRFDHVGSGLASRDANSLTRFTIAAADRNFVEAEAKIDGDTVLVWSNTVAKPVAVRFGWHQEAQPNLVNKEGLPASPFRTDDRPCGTANER
jgi:sialate O-acetylesterase